MVDGITNVYSVYIRLLKLVPSHKCLSFFDINIYVNNFLAFYETVWLQAPLRTLQSKILKKLS